MAIDPHNLPQDAATLQQMLLRTLAELQVATAQLNVTSTELAAKERELQRVQHWLEQLLRQRYGQKRERVDENQLFLFAAQIASTGKEPPPEPKAAPAEPRPAPQGHGRQPLPKSLKRRRVVYDVPEAERHCPECHGALNHIGEDLREELEYVPVQRVFFKIDLLGTAQHFLHLRLQSCLFFAHSFVAHRLVFARRSFDLHSVQSDQPQFHQAGRLT